MTAIIWDMIQPFIGYIGFGLTALLAIWGKGKLDQRKGRKAAEAKQAAEQAQAEREAHERINRADTGAGLDDGQRIERLREFAAKHGNRPSKGTGR